MTQHDSCEYLHSESLHTETPGVDLDLVVCRDAEALST